MTLPFWILPRDEKKNRKNKAQQKTRLNLETLEARLVPTVNLPDLTALSGAPTSGTVDTWTSLSTFDPNSAVVDASGSATAPVISEWTHTAAPGESIVVTGAHFDSSTVFWVYGQTTSLDTTLLRASVQNINTDTMQAQITLPPELVPGSEYALWAMNSGDASDPVTINGTDAWWISQSATDPNHTFTIHGQNLTSTPGTWTTGSAPTAVYYRLVGSLGNFTAATIDAANPYSVTFHTSSTLTDGTYEFWINNEIGGALGWSKLTVDLDDVVAHGSNDVDLDPSTSTTPGTDEIAVIAPGDTSTDIDDKADFNTALLNSLIAANNARSTITAINLPTGTIPINGLIFLVASSGGGQNLTINGASQSGTVLKWYGADNTNMFFNNGPMTNYTISNLTIDNGSVLNSDPNSDLTTTDARYEGGAIAFNLQSKITNLKFDHVTIDSKSREAIKIRSQNSMALNYFDGIYISNSDFYTPGLTIANGKNLVISDNHFYVTNDGWHAIEIADIDNSYIHDNLAESNFAKTYQDGHSNADPSEAYVDSIRELSGADFGRRFFWSDFTGSNSSLERNTTKFLGVRYNSGTVGSFDAAKPYYGQNGYSGYDTNGGEQYGWDSSAKIGFSASPTSSSGTSLQFDTSDVVSIATGAGSATNLALLDYGDTNFYAVVVSGAGAGQVRHVIGYSSVSGTDTFTLDSAFDNPLSTSGTDISVVMVTLLFDRVTVYDNTITGMPGNRVGLGEYVGDIGISLFYNTYNFVVANNTINDIRWAIGVNAVAGVIGDTTTQLLGVAANNLITGNEINNARKGLVLQPQNFSKANGDSDVPAGVNTTFFGNVVRGNTFKQINEVGIQVIYVRSKIAWESSQIVNMNIVEWNNITLGDVTGEGAIESPQPIGIDLLENVNFNSGSADTNFAPITGFFIHKNTIDNTLPTNGESEDPSSIGLRVGMGQVAVDDGEDLPQQVILADNIFNGFDTVYYTPDDETLLPWDGEILVGYVDDHYVAYFHENDTDHKPTEGFRYQFDYDGDGTFDTPGDDITTQDWSTELDAFPDNLRIMITNLYSMSKVIFSLGNDAQDENSIFYIGSTENDSVTFTESSGDITVDWGGANEVFEDVSDRIVAYGNSGNDTINASAVTSIGIFAEAGGDDDSVLGTSLADTILGNFGDDSISGGDGDDVLFGDALDQSHGFAFPGGGDDTVSGGAGTDLIVGGGGNDLLDGGTGVDLIVGDFGLGSTDGGFINMGSSSDTIFGTVGNDTISGGDGNDWLLGGGGDDAINGADGDDVIVGDDANINNDVVDDSSFGGTGNDFIVGGDGNDLIYGGDGDDSILGDDLEEGPVFLGDGDDTIYGGDGVDFISGAAGNDVIHGGADNDVIAGDEAIIDAGIILLPTAGSSSGDDTIYGDDGDDVLLGLDGNDLISGGEGNDQIAGDYIYADDLTIIYFGDGNDTLNGNEGNDFIGGGAGDDQIAGGEGDDAIIGDEGLGYRDGAFGFLASDNDTLSGHFGADSITGDDGDDWIIGGGGDDAINGNVGNDIIVGDGGAIDSGTFIALSLTGSSDLGTGNDGIFGGEDDDLIYGGDGDDGILGDDISDLAVFFGDGNDTIYGGNGNDSIAGADGDDLIHGDAGNDIITGDAAFISSDSITIPTIASGDGDDTIYGDDDDDIILGLAGSDLIYGGLGNDQIVGDYIHFEDDVAVYDGNGNDTLYGNEGDDFIGGGAGNDLIEGNDGDDGIIGDEGLGYRVGGFGFVASDNDTLSGHYGADTITGGDGDDWIIGGGGNDSINGNDDDDVIVGDGGSIDSGSYSPLSLSGSSTLGTGDDTIFGGDGNDLVYAGDGNDIVNGDADADTVHGGNGADIVVGGSGADSLTGDDGGDIIVSGAITFTGGTYITFVNAVQAEWLSMNSYATRVANIENGSGGSAHNGTNYLYNSSSIDNDSAVDAVFGEDGTPDNADDWFLVDKTSSPVDTYSDAVLGEIVDDIDGF